MAENAESMPASAQPRLDIRPAKIPASLAASGLAADDRSARPNELWRRNAATPMATSGDRMSMPEYAGVTSRAPTANFGRNDGSGKFAPEATLELIAEA